ncbi:MAG TPA: hypothetical protein VL752_14235 [Acidisoma sp.]|jgi:hypothetical protein|uniref:hypothetical protein n=1 Tax=Acidisoma sp. TaxID=1872115 RepID=UPI002C1373AF|nr:hypothetical protein [Acidisoma sp.]HTI02103.1 hypothetical protein [Acidisoma sp.]
MSANFVTACRSFGREIAAGSRGIAMLTFGREEGIRAFNDDRDVARRSFVTALFAFPLFLVFHYLDWLSGTAPLEPTHALLLDCLTFPISWAGFALLAQPLLRSLGVEPRWTRYIAAWNWSNLAQYLLLLVTSLPLVLHAPSILAQTAVLVGYGWALWLEWTVTRLTLQVSPLAAAMVVAADVGFGAIVSLITIYPLPTFSF